MQSLNLMHGAGVLCYFNGVLLGRVTEFSYEYSVGGKAIRGLDFAMPFELPDGSISVTGTIKLLRLSGDGGAQGIGALPQVHEFGNLKYSTLMILDRNTGRPVFKSDYCKVTSESWGVPAKDLVRGSISFTAIGFSNEVATSNLVY